LFRLPLLVALSLLIAFGGGIWSTLVALDATTGFGAIKLGAWQAFPQAQTIDADPYAKAHRANAGELLLGSAEGLRFTAKSDDDGVPLAGGCTYVLSGQVPPARAWTLYIGEAARQGLPANLPVALNSQIVLRHADGSFDITISPTASPGNWLASAAGRPLHLVLTLLDTPTAGSSGLIDLTMPTLTRRGCGHV
jgi:hypothetical protein